MDVIALGSDHLAEAKKTSDRVKELRARYDAWFADVKSTRNFAGPAIHVGNDKESPTVLTRQDWRGPNAGWTPTSEGHWDVFVERPGKYRVTLDFEAAKADVVARIHQLLEQRRVLPDAIAALLQIAASSLDSSTSKSGTIAPATPAAFASATYSLRP